MFENKEVKVLLANAGAGKLEWVEQIVPTPIGFRRFGDLKVGDYVYNAEGYPTMVLGIYPQGYTDVYKVTLSDGRSTECGLGHLWGVYSRTGHKNNEWKYEVLELKEMLRRGIRGKDKRKNRITGRPKFYVPASPVIEGEEKSLPCEPYILGSFIGNGCCTLKYLTLSSNDTWQVDKCARILGCKAKRNECNYSWNFAKEGHLVKTQDIIPSDLACYADEKNIPSVYMFASIEQRKSLLQGLFDTDGSISITEGRLHISYSTSSKKLCEDIRNLLLTFGIVSSVREDKRSKNINYDIKVNCSKEKAEFLFSLPRKLDKVMSFERKIHRDYTKLAIRSVEKLPVKKETMCIYVGNEKHLYLTKDFIVTHNTSTLIKYIEEELKTRRPEEIAFVTFTKKGADEGLRRVCDKFRLTPEELPYFRTLHSLTFHALNLKVNQMFSAIDQKEFNKAYGYYLNRVEVSKGKAHPTKDSLYLDYYDLERSNALTSKQIAESDIDVGYYHSLVQKYEEFKASKCAVDFFDCLIKYVLEGDSLPCKVVMIDEAQDITALQWKVIEKAFKYAEKVYVAGDDKQSLYTYSGARPDILIKLASQYPVVHLAKSYRIPLSVYRLANAITDFIGEKTEQMSEPREENGEGSITQLSDTDRLAKIISPVLENKSKSSWFILARNKCFLDRAMTSLEDNLIPYWTVDGFFMGGEVMKRLTDYESFRLEGFKSEDKRQQFAKKFGITNFSVPFTDTNLFTEGRKWVYASYIEKYGIELLKEMCKWNPQVLVSTIHAQKGSEAENVAVLLDATRKTKRNVFEDIDEELRCLYVAVTRTKKNLYLIDSKDSRGYDDLITCLKNQFCLNF